MIKNVSFLSGIWNSMPGRNDKNPENNELVEPDFTVADDEYV